MKKFFIYTGIIIAIFVLVYFGLGFWLVQSTGARVAAGRDQIKAAGDKVYLTDYETDPIPDDENAYHYLMLAKADLEAFDNDHSEVYELYEIQRDVPDEQIEQFAKIVEKYPAMYEHLEQAAACGTYRPDYDYSQGMMMLMPEVNLFRNAARAFSLKALVEAHRGNGDAALNQAGYSLRVSHHLQNPPTIVDDLVRIACQAIATLSANHTLRVAETSPEARERLDRILAAIDNKQSGIDAMKGERACGIQTFQQMRDGTLNPDGMGVDGLSHMTLLNSTWLGQAYLNDDEAKYIELLDKQIEACELPRAEREALLEPFCEEFEESRFRHLFTRLLVPALNAAANASDRAEANLRCLRILLAIEGQDSFDIENIDLPAAVKADPYSDGLLKIVMKDGEPVVYSIYENEIDDGGHVFNTEPESYDQPLDQGFGPLGEALEIENPELGPE